MFQMEPSEESCMVFDDLDGFNKLYLTALGLLPEDDVREAIRRSCGSDLL